MLDDAELSFARLPLLHQFSDPIHDAASTQVDNTFANAERLGDVGDRTLFNGRQPECLPRRFCCGAANLGCRPREKFPAVFKIPKGRGG